MSFGPGAPPLGGPSGSARRPVAAPFGALPSYSGGQPGIEWLQGTRREQQGVTAHVAGCGGHSHGPACQPRHVGEAATSAGRARGRYSGHPGRTTAGAAGICPHCRSIRGIDMAAQPQGSTCTHTVGKLGVEEDCPSPCMGRHPWGGASGSSHAHRHHQLVGRPVWRRRSRL